MNPTNRRSEIVNMIRQQGRVTVDNLAETLSISRETIRRDLTELARKGKVLKFHGGASLPMVAEEGSFRRRMGENVEAKVKIGAEAVKLITPGETLLIDTGSTTLYFAEQLSEIPDLTIVTNSTEIARVIGQGGGHARTFLLGGEFNGDNRQTIGSLALSQLRTFRAHHAILTIGALDSRSGVMDFCIEEAQIARAMIEQAEALTLLTDSSKFGRIASFEVCDLKRVTNLICDQPPSGKIREALTAAKVNVVSVAG